MSTPFDELPLQVWPGAGLVHRSPGAILVAPDPADVQLPVLVSLLEICTGPPDPTGRRIVRRVAGLLAEGEPETVPDFCLLVRSGDALAVLAHGDVTATVSGVRSARVSGAESLAWVERRIEWPVDEITVTGKEDDDHPGEPRLPYSLQRGTVPGRGARLVAGGTGTPPLGQAGSTSRPASSAEQHERSHPDVGEDQVEAAEPPRSFQSVLLLDPEPVDHRRALPISTSAEEVVEADGEEAVELALVEGALCSRGHFNDPESPYCSVCGISMVQRTRETVLRPRPALGVLVLDDGSAYTITSGYVIGREPEIDPAVAGGAARPLPLDDDTHGVSRVHASITLEGWRVLLTDRGSSNGTYLATAGESGPWTALEPLVPVPLVPGTHVRMGRRQLVFDSYHQKFPDQ